jgi:hypothetical protein
MIVTPGHQGRFVWQSQVAYMTEVGQVSEYLSEYIYLCSGLIDATSILPCELEAPPLEKCVIAQLILREQPVANRIS